MNLADARLTSNKFAATAACAAPTAPRAPRLGTFRGLMRWVD